MIDVTTKAEGFAGTLRELGQLAPELRKESVDEMRAAVAPIISTARSMVPGTPVLTNKNGRATWRPTGRTGFQSGAVKSSIQLKINNRARRKPSEWTMAAVVMKNPGGTIYDMAGKTNGRTESGKAFVAKLRRSYNGQPSRVMWPAAEAHASDVQAAVARAVRNTEARLNQALKVVR